MPKKSEWGPQEFPPRKNLVSVEGVMLADYAEIVKEIQQLEAALKDFDRRSPAPHLDRMENILEEVQKHENEWAVHEAEKENIPLEALLEKREEEGKRIAQLPAGEFEGSLPPRTQRVIQKAVEHLNLLRTRKDSLERTLQDIQRKTDPEKFQKENEN